MTMIPDCECWTEWECSESPDGRKYMTIKYLPIYKGRLPQRLQWLSVDEYCRFCGKRGKPAKQEDD